MEAFLWILLSSFVVTFFSINFYGKYIGNYMCYTEESEVNTLEVKEIFISIKRAAFIFPFKIKCLVFSIVLKKMLDKRNIKNTLYLGLQKDNSDKLVAHAWISVGNKSINKRKFIQVAYFS